MATCYSMSTQPGRPKTSPVWEYFKYNGILGKTICQVNIKGKLCEATFKGKFSTNLKAHLKGKHPSQYEELAQKEIHISKKKEEALAKSKRSRCNFKGQQTTHSSSTEDTKV